MNVRAEILRLARENLIFICVPTKYVYIGSKLIQLHSSLEASIGRITFVYVLEACNKVLLSRGRVSKNKILRRQAKTLNQDL